MSELDELLDATGGRPLPLYLIWGEEFLVRQGADELVAKLLPNPAPGLNFAVMDGASPREVAQELATLPMIPGRKVVLLRDPEFIAPKKGKGDGLSKARDAWKSGRRKEGARRVLALVARAGWGVEALEAPAPAEWKQELNIDLAQADLAFLAEVAAFCKEERVTAPEGDATQLADTLRSGLPEEHSLVIAATDVDPRHPLVKLAGEIGAVVERKLASRLKDLDVSEVVQRVLGPLGKRLGPGAEEMLKDRCGANMRLLQSELEKLALYQEEPTIRTEDVERLVSRSREEEFLELSDSLQKRDFRAALRYATDAMDQGSHPLQLLGAVASIVRGLTLNGERGKRNGARGRMTFNEFKSEVLPGIEREAKAAKEKLGHPFAIYSGIQAAGRYGSRDLLSGLTACAEADLAIKTSANGRLVIERLLWGLCATSAS